MAVLRNMFPMKAFYTFSKILQGVLHPNICGDHAPHSTKLSNFSSFPQNDQKPYSKQTLVFDLEGALLKSSSLFPYFMLVAFEAGGLIRAFILLLLYPLVCSVGRELGIKIMVFISFVGIRVDKFIIGRAVLPKFFLEDVGSEGFEVVMRSETKIGVTELPLVMVECFLREYLGVEGIVGRELMVVQGFYVGFMEDNKVGFNEIQFKGREASSVVGFWSSNKSFPTQLLPHCKRVKLVTEAEKESWQVLPRSSYPKPLIFHDGRLAFRPTPFATLSMFMWLPFGLILSIFRMSLGILLPYHISASILAFSGTRSTVFNSQVNADENTRGMLYVCNHRTLLDAVYISVSLGKNVTAVTYGVSRVSEIISPIRTVRLTRNRDSDRELMVRMLSQGDLVVCPEGTTCREPYLLRFSPLFAELTEEVVPVAVNVKATMFYGSTASGFKGFDPFCHFLNPYPTYSIKFLDKVPTINAYKIGGQASIDVANGVQQEIAKALVFECTSLTRKDKYMVLAGNNGIL